MRAVTKELEVELAKLPRVLSDRSSGAVAVAAERA